MCIFTVFNNLFHLKTFSIYHSNKLTKQEERTNLKQKKNTTQEPYFYTIKIEITKLHQQNIYNTNTWHIQTKLTIQYLKRFLI